MRIYNRVILFQSFLVIFILPVYAQTVNIKNDLQSKTVVLQNKKLKLLLNYDKTANISDLVVNGEQVIHGSEGIYSLIKTKTATYSSLHLLSKPSIQVTGQKVVVDNIVYGDKTATISERWTLTVKPDDIRFDISRHTSAAIVAEKMASPVMVFNNIHTWEGAYQDYGGLAWFYLFNRKKDTYGVYSHISEFWNSKTGNGLAVSVASTGKEVVMNYSRGIDDQLYYSIGISSDTLLPRFDTVTRRRLYLRDTTNIWSQLTIPAGTTDQGITIAYFDFEKKYGRGKLVGINQQQVSSVLNTIARIGVIGKKHFGGNSWHTPYGPICLHEQYIAQMGIGINDDKYLAGYRECLDFYRDNAMKPDGRVWPRWAYSNEDAMPGIFTSKGFYEAQWGYLLDSNPDYVINVSELYDQNGDLHWVKTHQQSCEKALDWILNRDSNHNGLVEMMTDSHREKKGSDWIDIIWASYENAFVNAKLYHALVLWADIEQQLGNRQKAIQYQSFAEKLKSSFNKTTAMGGFWDEEKKCYIHWRDKDGSVHGNNMVTPVNFMAIAYDICDDTTRAHTILDNIEVQMQKEQLFFWPLCLYSYAPGEGNDWQFPFPNYENGDIFLSWGSVAMKAYALYKPEIALKYLKQVLAQYAKDGLAFQRYGRAKQEGLGDDILSGNSLSVVGLYQAVYGINPKYNRFYLAPHITSDLAGTQLRYNYRGKQLLVTLNKNSYSVADEQYSLSAKSDFGFYSKKNELLFFKGSASQASLQVRTSFSGQLFYTIEKWEAAEMVFTQRCTGTGSSTIKYQVNGLVPDAVYAVSINDSGKQELRADSNGSLVFNRKPLHAAGKTVIVVKPF